MKSDYYVYLHRTLDGSVFYVGKGRDKRAWSIVGRSKGWKVISDKGYSVEIYRQGLYEKDALEVETDLIKTLDGLVNTRILMPVEFDDYAEYFAYDTASPSGLTRIKEVSIGKRVYGEFGPCGYKITRSCGGQNWIVSFRSRNVQVHRIIWQLFNGKIPDGFIIDHTDGDPLNNKIDNLRLTTKAENNRNARKPQKNTSGLAGVSLGTNNNIKESRWVASYYNLDGKRVCRNFSINKYGKDEAFRLACEWRQQMIAELNLQGAGYTERHGT